MLTAVCSLSMLYICEFCLKYIKSSSILQRHLVSNELCCFSQSLSSVHTTLPATLWEILITDSLCSQAIYVHGPCWIHS